MNLYTAVAFVFSAVHGAIHTADAALAVKKCCSDKQITCLPTEHTKYGNVTYTPSCCGDGKWYCQRNGKGTAGHVCNGDNHGGMSKACPVVPEQKCCKGTKIKCPPTEQTKYGKVTYTPVCCGNGKWFCQRDGKGTAGHVCGTKGAGGNNGISQQCNAVVGPRRRH